MKIGYIRVSTGEQQTLRQEELMRTLEVEKIYIDVASGKDTKRPQLAAMLAFMRSGDTVIVESISRLARNTRDLLDLISQLETKEVELISRKELIDTSSPTGRFMLTVFGAVAELERSYLLERQREGIAIAKQSGKYKGRTPIPISESLWREVYSQWHQGHISCSRAAKRLGASQSTFFRRVRNYRKQSEQ